MTQDEINSQLKQAVMMGTQDDVIDALSKGADLFLKDNKGNSLLATAAFKRNFETFNFLLQVDKGGKKIDLNETNYAQQNIIMAMIEGKCDLSFVKTVIEAGADVNAYKGMVLPPLMYALAHEDEELFGLLLEAGADVNVQLKETLATPLLMLTTTATSKNMDKMCVRLLEAGADVNAQDRNGRTPLMNLKLRSKSFMKQIEVKSTVKTEKLLINHPNLNVGVTDVGGADTLFYYMSEGQVTKEALKLIELGSKIDVWQELFISKNVKTSTAHLIMSYAAGLSNKFMEKSLEEKKSAQNAPASQTGQAAQNQPAPQSPNGWGIGAGMMPVEEDDGMPKNVDELYDMVMGLMKNENIDLTRKNSLGNSIAALAMMGSDDFVERWLNDNNPVVDKIYEFDRKTANLREVLIINKWISSGSSASTEILDRLLKLGIQSTYSKDGTDVIGSTEPLFNAITSVNVNAVQLLLQDGLDPNMQLKVTKDSEFYSPLRIFATGIMDGNYNKALSDLHKQKELKKAYEENEANGVENSIITKDTYEKICENIENLEKVSETVDNYRMLIISELINAGVDVNLIDKNNRTPIFYANDEKTYEILKNFGADIFAENENKENYLMYLLTKANKPKILSLVLNEYKDLNDPLGVRPFYEIAFNEESLNSSNLSDNIINNLTLLLNDEDKKSLIHNRQIKSLKENLERYEKRLITQKEPSAYGYNEKLIENLEKDIGSLKAKLEEMGEPKKIEYKDINYQDENGNSPLLIACAMSNNRFARFFLEIGSDIELENAMKETPLMHAISSNDPTLVELLISAGADATKVNAEGKSVLDFANEIENPEILEAVMKKLDPTIESGSISNRRSYRY